MRTLKIKYSKINRSKLLVDRKVLNDLIKRVRRYEKVEIVEEQVEPQVKGIMKLAEKGGSLKFLYNKKHEVYSVADAKVRYK